MAVTDAGDPATSDEMHAQAAAAPLAGQTAFAATVDAAVRGDRDAWHWLFDRFYSVVLRYSMARLGDAAAAEDVTQEVFCAAVTAIGRLRERSEPGVEGWFVGIARLKVADRCRQRAREARCPAPELRVGNAEEVATGRLAVGELWQAMEALTEDQRDVLVRRFVLDQSLEEVARATGRRVNAVKQLQHRAVAALGRVLGDRGEMAA